MFLSWCYHLAPISGLSADLLDEFGFSSPEPSSENKCACVTSIKIPLSAFLSLRKEKIVVNIPYAVICSFTLVLSQKEFRMKMLGFPVLFLGLFLYFFTFLRHWIHKWLLFLLLLIKMRERFLFLVWLGFWIKNTAHRWALQTLKAYALHTLRR